MVYIHKPQVAEVFLLLVIMFIMSVVWNVFNDRVADRTQMIKNVFRLFFNASLCHLNILKLRIFVIF